MELKINNKLVAFDGCIGRRDYFINILYVCVIAGLMTLPFSLWMMTNISNPLDAYNVGAQLAKSPIFAKFFYILACVVCSIFSLGLLARRLADIWGKSPRVLIYSVALLLLAGNYFFVFVMNSLTTLFMIITTIIGFIILFTKGKISSQIPHDPVKRFNWGAFWGTWIWGLFNKTYVTLWSLLLLFTPAGIYWMLICGMKGNEWAFKNTKALEVEAFHKSQKKQAIFWNSFTGFIIFVLPILLVFLITATAVTATVNNPEKVEAIATKAENWLETYILEQFDDYELDIDENKFYMDPRNWVGLDYNDKYNLLKGVASVAAAEKRRSESEKFENYQGYRSDEMLITKIYSSYNGELLAEYNVGNMDGASDFKSVFKAAMQALYFNTNPELPPPPTKDNEF